MCIKSLKNMQFDGKIFKKYSHVYFRVKFSYKISCSLRLQLYLIK